MQDSSAAAWSAPVLARRLLAVNHYPVFGGPHNQMLRLNGALAELGWRTVALLPDEPGTAASRLRAGGVEVVQTRLHRPRGRADPRANGQFLASLWRDVSRVRSVIRAYGIHLVLLSGLLNPQAALAARLERLPVVWQVVDSRPPHLIRLALVRLVDLLAHAIMFDGERLVELHGGSRAVRSPFFIYYPPVPTDLYSPDRTRAESTRHEYGIPLDAPVVGTVANLNPQKGIEHFVQAAAIIHQRRPDAWYLIVGETYSTHARYRARLEAEVAAAGLPRGRMLFAGGTRCPERFYPAMDVKVITSLPNSEGTTTTALEAMACGIPVVTTDVGAVREVVPDGVAGFVVPPLRPDAIAKCVLRLLQDGCLRQRLADAARQIAVARYGVPSCANEHVAAFEAALALRQGH